MMTKAKFLKVTKEEKMPYLFNKITVRPQLPKRIGKLYDVSHNVWWSWNTDFLKLFNTKHNYTIWCNIKFANRSVKRANYITAFIY